MTAAQLALCDDLVPVKDIDLGCRIPSGKMIACEAVKRSLNADRTTRTNSRIMRYDADIVDQQGLKRSMINSPVGLCLNAIEDSLAQAYEGGDRPPFKQVVAGVFKAVRAQRSARQLDDTDQMIVRGVALGAAIVAFTLELDRDMEKEDLLAVCGLNDESKLEQMRKDSSELFQFTDCRTEKDLVNC